MEKPKAEDGEKDKHDILFFDINSLKSADIIGAYCSIYFNPGKGLRVHTVPRIGKLTEDDIF
ncbi:hypothetical protein [Desulfocicer niacini]